MKNNIFILLFAIIFFNCTGYQYITSDQANYEVIKDHPLNKPTAFKASVEWIATNFNSANDVIQLKDEESGKIIVQAVGSYYFDFLKSQLIHYRYTLTLTLKDNKVRYHFTTLNIVDGSNPPYEKDLSDVIASYDSTIKRMTDYLINYKKDEF